MIKHITFILVEPQMGENIGATARVMHNFGLTNLRIVNPRDGWPSDKAIAMSAGAKHIIEQAEIYNNLSDALDGIEQAYALTARTRAMNKTVLDAKNLNSKLDTRRNIAFIFGRENSGLTNEEIALCSKVVTINVNKSYGSLNLAQAAGIIAYELFDTQKNILQQKQLTSLANRQLLANNIIEKLGNKNYFVNTEKKQQFNIKLQNIINNIDNFTDNEFNLLQGVINKLDSK